MTDKIITLMLTLDEAQNIVNAIAAPYLNQLNLIEKIRTQAQQQIVVDKPEEVVNVEEVHTEGDQEAGQPSGDGEA